jgi:hypothetical protein
MQKPSLSVAHSRCANEKLVGILSVYVCECVSAYEVFIRHKYTQVGTLSSRTLWTTGQVRFQTWRSS